MDRAGGSSPRAWGIRRSAGHQPWCPRFIPTCVGNTCRHDTRCGPGPVHPHVRGEYMQVRGVSRRGSGSSPRAWGILAPLTGSLAGIRFIPTCVGNTTDCSKTSLARSVHPHVRGEYVTAHARHIGKGGSSPRAWGILLDDMGGDTKVRFIPTCVGNTCPMPLARPVTTVHPHVRGEYKWATENVYGVTGSSPRAWGIPFRHTQRTGHARFIPTCVGNTPICAGHVSSNSVHPHVRGEYLAAVRKKTIGPGSSPRAWGIHSVWCLYIRPARFIPTCVGNTPSPPPFPPLRSVHPHVRGEYMR